VTPATATVDSFVHCRQSELRPPDSTISSSLLSRPTSTPARPSSRRTCHQRSHGFTRATAIRLCLADLLSDPHRPQPALLFGPLQSDVFFAEAARSSEGYTATVSELSNQSVDTPPQRSSRTSLEPVQLNPTTSRTSAQSFYPSGTTRQHTATTESPTSASRTRRISERQRSHATCERPLPSAFTTAALAAEGLECEQKQCAGRSKEQSEQSAGKCARELRR